MKVKYLGDKQRFKTSTNTGLFYEFIDGLCDVDNSEDIDYFSNHAMFEVEKKKVKKGSDE